ncbi:MAG: hypothetical protein AAGD43_21405 [Pseudomonadota bacterium]
MNSRLISIVALCVSLLVVWTAYSTGLKAGRESAPEYYALQMMLAEQDSEYIASLSNIETYDEGVCRAMIALAQSQNSDLIPAE